MVRACLDEKCRFKGIPVPELAAIEAHRGELEADWEAMLAPQLPVLPPFEHFWEELGPLLRWLRQEEVPAASTPYPMGSDEQPVYLGGAGTWRNLGGGGFLELIRFAASSHLCVDLDYIDEKGSFGTRTIEPYSLRTTTAGYYVLHAERADGTGHREYRVDRIQGARVTNRGFTPKYAIELTASGPIVAPPQVSRHSSRAGGVPRSFAGPTYVLECGLCGKRFTRSRMDATLRPHKDPNGWPCAGRTGFWADTRY
jgi:hypothetical protein